MHTRKLIGLIAAATTALVVALAALAANAQPAAPKWTASGSVLSVNAPPNGFLGGTLVTEVNGPPVAAYGVLKLAGKPRYTYLILFKTDAKQPAGGASAWAISTWGTRGERRCLNSATFTRPICRSRS